MDVVFAWIVGRLARRAGGNALLPAQDKEDTVLDTILGDRAGVAGCIMAIHVWRSE